MAQGTTGSVALSAEVKTAYDADYYIAVQNHLYHDQFADPKYMNNGVRGSSWEWPITESLQPSTAVLDELSDVTPQKMLANAINITLAEYGGAVEMTKFASAVSYADVYSQAAEANGYSMAESIDLIVRAVMGQGGRQFYQNPLFNTARSSFAGLGTPANHGAADRITVGFIEQLATYARGLKMPLYDDGSISTLLHPFVFYDLLQQTDVRNMAIRLAPELLFNGELAYWGGLRICVAANAKAFWGAGAAPAGTPYASLSTTLAAPTAAGDSNIKVASVSNAAVGQWIVIQDGAESGNTWYDTNEAFYVTAVGTGGAGGTGITGFAFDPGPGDAGGVRYVHPTGTAVVNNNSVYPVPVIGPESITKIYSDLTGPYGETVVTGPFDRLGRFLTFGWYGIFGWGRTRSGWLMRGEVGSSQS